MSDPQQLISGWLDGELDDVAVGEFDAWLGESPDHQRRYLRALIDHRALRERGAARRFSEQAPSGPRRIGAHRPGSRPALLPRALLAAGLAAAVVGAWALWRARPTIVATPDAPVIVMATAASLTGSDGPAAALAGVHLRPDERLAVDDGGAAQVRFADGTAVTIAGGSEAWFSENVAGKRVGIGHGRVAAEVAPQPAGHPAVFATPEAEVTVIGTALTVASVGGESQTEVSHGRVSMRRLADRAEVAIGAGETALVAPGQPLIAKPTGAVAGNLYSVGEGQPYATIAAVPELRPGDVVEIHPGTYKGARIWSGNGTALRPITIRGVGAGPATIDGEGLVLTGIGNVPRALFQLAGEHWRIENLAFVNAHNGANAAGIRCAGSRHTVIRGCRISRCDAGLSAEDDDLLVEDCEIASTGTAEKDGYCHGLSVSGDRAVVRGCSIHDALYGQALRGGSRWLEIRGCRIAAAEDGEISFFDGPGADRTDSAVVMIGNLVVSKAVRRGNHQRFIELGADGAGQRHGTLYLFSNTLVAADPRQVPVSTVLGAAALVAENNLIVGSDQPIRLGSGGLSGRRNWLPPAAVLPPGLRESVPATAAGPGFVDAAHGDFHLRPDSACAGRAAGDSRYHDADGRERIAVPDLEPPRDAAGAAKPRASGGDVGAFAAQH